MNIASNIICVQASGDTAKQLSERFGKIMQYRESPSINRMDTSISRSKQLETAVPPSTISGLSSGELVGMMSDTPDQHIDSKTFHCEIINDTDALQKKETAYVEIPDVRGVTPEIIQRNYDQSKQDIHDLLRAEIQACWAILQGYISSLIKSDLYKPPNSMSNLFFAII
jgi:hypothetical protein